MKAVETHKMHDEYFILRKNGKYAHKVSVMGVINMPDNNTGRYLLSNDTVYFVKKIRKKTFLNEGYGVIDRRNDIFLFKPYDLEERREYNIHKMPM